MVSYLNSKPFEFGLKKGKYAEEFEVVTETPSNCAKLFEKNEVEIVLIPSGALHDLAGEYRIISDYCIGCDGEVRTVCIFSNVPLDQCTRLITDNHSRTSVLLSALILKEEFNLEPEIISDNVSSIHTLTNDAILMIGDKVFEKESSFHYKYDLGLAWKKLTGLQLAFAVWAARDNITAETEDHLNQSFEFGMANLNTIIEQESSESLDLFYYFMNNISYSYNENKRLALDLYLNKTKKYHNQLIIKS